MLNMNAARVRVAVKISQLDKDVLDTLSIPRSEYIRIALEEKLARDIPGYDQARHETRDWTGTGWPGLPEQSPLTNPLWCTYGKDDKEHGKS